MGIQSKTLANGLKIIYVKRAISQIISIQAYVRVGSCWEEKNEAGYAHFTEHLVFKASKDFPDSSHFDFVTNHGGNLNAYTEYDSTCFYVSLPSTKTAEGMHVLSQLVRYPMYDEEDFESEKNVVLEELKQYQNDPEDFFIEETPKYYFEENPIRNPIIGTADSISSATMEALYAFHKAYYNPKNVFLVVVGDLPENFEEIIDHYWGDWDVEGKTMPLPMEYDYPNKFEFKKIESKFKSNFIGFLLPECSDRDEDSSALAIAGKAFAVGKNSRLHKRLVVEDKLADAIRVHSLSGIFDGVSAICVIPKKNIDLLQIIEVFKEEKDRFFAAGLTYDEFQNHIKELTFSYRYSQEYIESFGMSIGQDEVLTGYEEFLTYLEKLNTLSVDDIKKVIKKYYSNNRLKIFHIGKKDIDASKVVRLFKEEKNPLLQQKKEKEYYNFMLSNGLKVIFKKVKKHQTVGISLVNPTSQLYENLDERGRNVLAQTLLMYGTKTRSHADIIDYCTNRGINISTTAGNEVSSIKVKCFRELLDNALSLIHDIIAEPVFPNDYVKSIRKSFLGAHERIKEYPSGYGFNLWKKQIFGKDSQLVFREGTPYNLRNISRKKIVQWHEDHTNIEAMTLAIVGDLEPQLVMEKCETFFGIIPKKDAKPKANLILAPNERKIVQKKFDSDQAVIHLGGFAMTSHYKQKNTALFVLMQILGGDLNSRLFQKLREENGLAYTVGVETKSLQDVGFYHLFSIVNENTASFAVQLMLDEIKNIREHGIKESELQMVKNYVHGNRLFEEESVMTQATILATLEVLGYGIKHYLTRTERLNNVTCEMVQEITKEYLKEDSFYIHILGK